MPILDVEIVGKIPTTNEEQLAQRLANVAGEVLKSNRSGTWVKVRFLNPEDYAENGGAPEGVAPVFVRIIQKIQPPPEQLRKQADALSSAVATVCDRQAENVHIIYEPPGRGRIAFGGKLVE
jgi:phenylpyruvate tautomerase PptA (4-oxalocrotonate tautomerase family)